MTENRNQMTDLFYGYKNIPVTEEKAKSKKGKGLSNIIIKSTRSLVVFALIGVITSIIYLFKFLFFIINFIF